MADTAGSPTTLAPHSAGTGTLVAETRCGDFRHRSRVRTFAQSRADLESPRARVLYTAAHEFPISTVLRTAALQSRQRRFLAAYGDEAPGAPRLPRQQPREPDIHTVNWNGTQPHRRDYALPEVHQLPVLFAFLTNAFHTIAD